VRICAPDEFSVFAAQIGAVFSPNKKHARRSFGFCGRAALFFSLKSAGFPGNFLHIQIYVITLSCFWQALSCSFSAFQAEKSEMSVNNHLLHILT